MLTRNVMTDDEFEKNVDIVYQVLEENGDAIYTRWSELYRKINEKNCSCEDLEKLLKGNERNNVYISLDLYNSQDVLGNNEKYENYVDYCINQVILTPESSGIRKDWVIVLAESLRRYVKKDNCKSAFDLTGSNKLDPLTHKNKDKYDIQMPTSRPVQTQVYECEDKDKDKNTNTQPDDKTNIVHSQRKQELTKTLTEVEKKIKICLSKNETLLVDKKEIETELLEIQKEISFLEDNINKSKKYNKYKKELDEIENNENVLKEQISSVDNIVSKLKAEFEEYDNEYQKHKALAEAALRGE